MFNEMIVVSVTPFSGTTTPDKNGKPAVMLQCIAGKIPNRNVLSGTVAERIGFEVGKTYLANVRERGKDEVFGVDFTFTKVQELKSGEDIARTVEELGKPEILIVNRPEGFEKLYERKGDAVESLQTKRQREGLYKPSVNTQRFEHETANGIVEGSTITGADEMQKGIRPEDLKKAAAKAKLEGSPLKA